MNKLYSRKEAAELLGMGLTKLDEERADGKIAYIQRTINGRVYFTDEALQEYVARLTKRAKPIEAHSSSARIRRSVRR